jgi:translation elongation factor EF-Tu-like GTPase
MSFIVVEGRVRYLTTEDGGRQRGMFNGYRGQFHYEGEDHDAHDAIQEFPDFKPGGIIELGLTVRVLLFFPLQRWNDFHAKRISVGMPFEIREGRKVVGRGVITGVPDDASTK